MINKKALEDLINETLTDKESVLLSKPEDKKVIKEEKQPETSEET